MKRAVMKNANVSNESISHSLSSGGYKHNSKYILILHHMLIVDHTTVNNIISTHSGHLEEITFPVFHHITSWMLSFFSRMERAKAALSSVDKQMLEG